MNTKEVARSSAEFESAIKEMSVKAGEILKERALQLYKKLTYDERLKFSSNGEHPVRLAKTLLCVVEESITYELGAESIIPAINAIRKIDNNRY